MPHDHSELPSPPRWDIPIPIAEGVFWVGFLDTPTGMTCNPYLIVDGEEAVLIDGGSRPDFPTVMMKILQTGCRPEWIRALIYLHYDPDVCGSAPNFEDIIGRTRVNVISAYPNHMFIRHIIAGARISSLGEIGERYRFSSGRTLRFIPAPYAHSAGSFMTLDEATGTLFTGDLFGSIRTTRSATIRLEPRCRSCTDFTTCHEQDPPCPLPGILEFHRNIFPSNACVHHAMNLIRDLPFQRIAPQHGTVIDGRESGLTVIERLLALDDIGIDGVLKNGQENHFLNW